LFTIQGSGFGLYGYLPALFRAGEKQVILPRRYREIIESRPELLGSIDRIIWSKDNRSALEAATGAVIAGRPLEQPAAAHICLSLPNLRQIVLEKPLAATPVLAGELLNDLAASGRQIRLSYLFLFTPVERILRRATRAGDMSRLSILWTFMAHHFENDLDTWKRQDDMGGGAIRFYGVHLIAVLAACGYQTVSTSIVFGTKKKESERWEAVLDGPGLPSCEIVLDSRNPESAFEIHASGSNPDILVKKRDPFAEDGEKPSAQDRRVPFLADLLRSFSLDDAPFLNLYAKTNRLWADVEDLSKFVHR